MASSDKKGLLHERDCAIVAARTDERGIIIFFHGLGDVGESWASILGMEEVCPSYYKIICPTAPTMKVSINRGMKMPSWYDVYDLSPGAKDDEPGMTSMTKQVHDLIDEVKASSPTTNIVLGGISQGGALALHAGLTYPKPLAGLLLLSTWLPFNKTLPQDALDIHKTMPIFLAHGESDPLVDISRGREIDEFLKKFGTTNHVFRTYPGLGHWIFPKETDDICEWLGQI